MMVTETVGSVASSGTIFRTVLWKELRENVASAAIALGIVAAGLYFSTVLFASAGAVGFATEGLSISLFTLTSAGAGLLIGYKQVARDDRGDMWALLTHRPATRSQLFWAKAIAAALLYVAATAIPLVMALIWQATPGNRPAPFDIRMALGDVADLFTGVVYLLAAMLVTIRDARWYASRLLPIGLALGCTTVTLAVDHFVSALGVIVLSLIIVGTAARGAFTSGGAYAGQSRASRVTLAIALGFGLQIVGSFALAILGSMLALRTPEARSFRTTAVVVTRDGTLARIVSQIRLFDPKPRIDSVTDLTGRPLAAFEDTLSRDSVLTGVISAAAIPLTEGYSAFGRSSGYRGVDRIFVPLLPMPFVPGVGTTSWYFVRRAGLIAVYDNASARQIGWLGPSGFTESTTLPSVRFHGDLRSYSEFTFDQLLIAMPTAVYRLDRVNRRIRRVFTVANGDTVLGAAASGDSVGSTRGALAQLEAERVGADLANQRIRVGGTGSVDSVGTTAAGDLAQFDVIATRDSVYVQSPDGTPRLVVARDPRAMGYGTVTVTRALLAPGAPTFVRYRAAGGTLSSAELDTARDRVTEFGATNALVAQMNVPTASGPLLPERPEWAQIVGVGMLTPLASRAGFGLYARRLAARTGPVTAQAPGPRIVGWLAVIAGAIGAALITLVVGRRYAFDNDKMLVWVLVASVFGALGLLLMASLLDWPARERCPTCGRERVVTRDRCEHCGSAFAAPVRDGTEIFGGTWDVGRGTLIVDR